MTPADVKKRRAFIEAARSIAEGEHDWSCIALAHAVGGSPPIKYTPECQEYVELMRPDLPHWYKGSHMDQLQLEIGPHYVKDARDLRVLLLLFAGLALT